MKKEYIFPIVLMVLDVGAGIIYAYSRHIYVSCCFGFVTCCNDMGIESEDNNG